uniref:DUF4087 domain-containing protein n=1 Tax=Thaumasiovibrio occultus TaxID=1891184 RepID=UPI000B351C44|nr:DUF4087 domain-containing protein [Thaumasiovibrio occultus]
MALLFTAGSAPAMAQETRCGWFDNSSPANMELIDADGDWVISRQGALDFMLDDSSIDALYAGFTLGDEEMVFTNRNYGVRCVCVVADSEREVAENDYHITQRISKIYSAEQRPLERCYDDPAIGDYLSR